MNSSFKSSKDYSKDPSVTCRKSYIECNVSREEMEVDLFTKPFNILCWKIMFYIVLVIQSCNSGFIYVPTSGISSHACIFGKKSQH